MKIQKDKTVSSENNCMCVFANANYICYITHSKCLTTWFSGIQCFYFCVHMKSYLNGIQLQFCQNGTVLFSVSLDQKSGLLVTFICPSEMKQLLLGMVEPKYVLLYSVYCLEM